MSWDNGLVLILLLFIIVREFVFHYSMQLTINKLIARDFADYMQSKDPESLIKAKSDADFRLNQEMMRLQQQSFDNNLQAIDSLRI